MVLKHRAQPTLKNKNTTFALILDLHLPLDKYLFSINFIAYINVK